MATGKKKSKKKKNEGPDLLTIVVVLVAIILVVVLLVNYNKDKDGKEQPTPPPGIATTEAPLTPTAGAGQDERVTPQPTAAPIATPEATKAPETEATPIPTEVPVLSVDEAMSILRGRIDLAADAYSIELLDDHLMIEGEEYYNFCINDTNGEAMEPLLIVEKKEGTLLCYDYSGVVSQFSKFPLDKTETGSAGTVAITAEEAKKVLTGYSGAALGLAKEPSSYDMTVDEWTTVIQGKECYGINLFETSDGKQRFRGVFYVTLDGSAVYSADEVTGDFIER
ncbi:MAG: hypothetical protein IJW37_02540 [Lachnospiraceae bacterium]|nr:hypothetical protein [Lachnospiraceae bacterium]